LGKNTSQYSNREIQKRSITKRKVQFFLFFHFLSQKNNERRVASFVTFQGTACPSAYLALALSSLMHIKVCVVLTDVSDISAGILSYQLISAYIHLFLWENNADTMHKKGSTQ
jgi:hypothetical protein